MNILVAAADVHTEDHFISNMEYIDSVDNLNAALLYISTTSTEPGGGCY